ncbi:hypothetical protein HK405_005747, partial [Cladochytrium tenue]
PAKEGLYHFWHGWGIQAYVAYIIGIVPNFYGFLNNMGIDAPDSVTKFYYFAYPVGLVVAGAVYYGLCVLFPPPLMHKNGWHEPEDYVREDEETTGDVGDFEDDMKTIEKK